MGVPDKEAGETPQDAAWLNLQEALFRCKGYMVFTLEHDGNVLSWANFDRLSPDQIRAFFHLVENYRIMELWTNADPDGEYIPRDGCDDD